MDWLTRWLERHPMVPFVWATFILFTMVDAWQRGQWGWTLVLVPGFGMTAGAFLRGRAAQRESSR